MADVVVFLPKKGGEARDNLSAFIKLCRNRLSVFGNIDWSSDVWDISKSIQRSGHELRKHRIHFVRVDGTSLNAEYANFVKAYIRYRFGLRPGNGYPRWLLALRVLESALLEVKGRPDVTMVDPVVLNKAAELVVARYSRGVAYAVGRILGEIGQLLVEHHLVSLAFQWTSTIKPEEVAVCRRVGVKGEAERQKRLPSQATIDALPRYFTMAREPVDIIVSSILAILCSAPDRISEVFALPVDCEVEVEQDGERRYGLRWWPEKNAEPMVKWIPSIMADVVKDAVRRVIEVTRPARTIARWYVDNPGALYLPDDCLEYRDRRWLTGKDVAKIFGWASVYCRRWCLSRNMKYHHFNGKREGYFAFEEVEAAVVAMLPQHFPIMDRRTGLSFADGMLVMRYREMTHGFIPWRCMIEPVHYDQIRHYLIGQSNRGQPTVFDRMGLTEKDGSPIRLSTHQLRHWLNTLAQRGGLSQIDIAKWSGRANIRQNEVYDHMTAEELMAMTAEIAVDDPRLFGSLAQMAARTPLSREEFIKAQFPMAHVTDLGFCVHDFSMMPCGQHRDCVNCEEHFCIKGDQSKTDRICEQLDLAEAALGRAEAAMAEGLAGADRWYEHHTATTARLRNLLAVLTDPDVPNGSLVRLAVRLHTPALPIDNAAADEACALLEALG